MLKPMGPRALMTNPRDPFEYAARAFAQEAQRTSWMHDPAAWAYDVIDWGPGGGLATYQEDIVTLLAEHRRVAVRGPHGLGKALALDTPVATPGGWSTIADLRPGDEVFDEHGKPCHVVGKSPVWDGDTYEVEFADGTVMTTHGNHEWNAIDVYHRPKTPRPDRRPIAVADWRDHWAATRPVTTAGMAQQLRSPGGQPRWRVPTARPLELPTADLPVDPYLFGYWLGDGSSSGAQITVHASDWPNLADGIERAGYHHGPLRPGTQNPEVKTVSVSTLPMRYGGAMGKDSLAARLRTMGVLLNKHIPMAYLRASVEQRRELVRGLWDSDGYRQAGGCDEITLTCKPLVDGVAELLRSLGLAVRVRESDSTLNGRVVGRRWRIAARFDFNPYRLPRYDWTPAERQASRHTQRTVVEVRRVDDRPTQCIEVDSPSHLFLAGESMVPTHNSMTAAVTVLWFATTREAAGIDWKVVCTASAWRHLSVYLFPEIRRWARRIRWDVLGRTAFSETSELLALNLKLYHGAASAVASNKAELIEGAHADSLLYLIDEAKIVPDATWDAIEGAFSGGRTEGLPESFALAISTPGAPAGRFYDIHRRAPGLEDWHVRHVTLEEAIAAGRINREWAEQRKRQWGPDSALYANRTLGEFRASDEDSVIPLAWVEAAIERWHEWNDAGRPALEGRRFLGVDVARSGGDSTVLAHRHGVCITSLEAHDREDTMQTTARVQGAMGRVEADEDEGPVKPREGESEGLVPVVDSAGVGGGVVDRLREQGAPVLAYTGAAKTKSRTRDGEYGFTNCLTGDARVLPIGGLRRIYRSRYEGPLLKIKTSGGDDFTATPNHQVLTLRGWVAVQSLAVGDKLCDASVRDASMLGGGVRPEVDDVPPTISELYRSACDLFGSERVEGGAVDFHGDRPVGEVDVVTIDRELRVLGPAGREHLKHTDLVRPLVRQRPLSRQSALAHGFRTTDRYGWVGAVLPDRQVASSSELTLGESQLVMDQVVRLLEAAPRHGVVPQYGADQPLARVKGHAQCVDGFTGLVAAHDLGLVHAGSAARSGHLGQCPQRHSVFGQDAAHRGLLDTERLGQAEHGLTCLVPRDEVALIDAGHADRQAKRLTTPAWLDSVFAQDLVNGGPVSPELLRQRCDGLPGGVPLDEVISVERTTSRHGGTYVFTLETSTGSYRSQNVAHRNCRSAALWRVRELLDPAFGSELMLPPDDLLISDLTTPTWDITTGVPPKIKVEPKEDVVARLGRSPDRGDAVAMSLFAELLASSAIHIPVHRTAQPSKAASRYGRRIVG